MKTMLNPYLRYQKGLVMEDLFPTKSDRTCACGCGVTLVGRKKKWATKECMRKALLQFFIVKGDTSIIRKELFKIDKGYCRVCGKYDKNWQADHIKSVCQGGGACSIDNFQTLCLSCHKEKSKQLYSIPNGSNVLATRFYIHKPLFYRSRTFNKGVRKNIVRDAVCFPSNKIVCFNKF